MSKVVSQEGQKRLTRSTSTPGDHERIAEESENLKNRIKTSKQVKKALTKMSEIKEDEVIAEAMGLLDTLVEAYMVGEEAQKEEVISKLGGDKFSEITLLEKVSDATRDETAKAELRKRIEKPKLSKLLDSFNESSIRPSTSQHAATRDASH